VVLPPYPGTEFSSNLNEGSLADSSVSRACFDGETLF